MYAGLRLFVSFTLLFAFGSLTASAQDAKSLLEEARDRHRAALEGIRTVTYSYELQELKSEALHYKGGPYPVPVSSAHAIGPGRYWQTPEAWRRQSLMSDGTTSDEVFRFGLHLWTSTARDDNPKKILTITAGSASGYAAYARFDGPLFSHLSRDSGFLPFHFLLEQPHEIRSVERISARAEGQSEVHVVFGHTPGIYEFWFSPTHNYLIRKRVERPAAQPHHRYESEVSEFVETNRGQFFPAQVDHKSFENGDLKQHSREKLSDVRINHPIPKEAFRIPGIEGGWCEDSATQTRYRVDADGYRMGEAQAIPVAPAPVPPRRPDPPAPDQDGSTLFWLGVTITVLALGLCVAVFGIRSLRAELRKRDRTQ